MKPRVTLVNTNMIEPLVAPIGLDYLAEALACDGFDVELLDLALAEGDWREVTASHFRARRPDVVGVTFRNTDDCYMASGRSFLPLLEEVVEMIRKCTDAPTVLGGAGFSVMPEAVLEAVGLDVGVWGEGEGSFGLLCERLAAGERIDDIPNLVFRGRDGWRRTPVSHVPLNLMPPQTRRFVDNKTYFERGGQGSIETKRGCAQACIYCADPVAKGSTQRLRSPRAVAGEMEVLLAQGVDCLHVCDSEFNLPERHAWAICEELVTRDLGSRVTWYAYAAPEPFSTELAKLMRSAGCAGIDFGADSGSDAQLARLGRRHHVADLRTTAEACREAGIVFMYDILLGGPGETRETVSETIRLMKQLEPDRVGVSVGVRLYPGTRLAQAAQGDGFHLENPAAFYVSEHLGDEIWSVIAELVGDDPRFFFTDPTRPRQNYNYNDNRLLVEAIADGERGAYWDILRRLQ